MYTRYRKLREVIAALAAPAEEQVAYLDRMFLNVTGGGSAVAYGNDELALELDDIYPAAGHMLECGEITEAEIDLIRPLYDMMSSRWEEGPASFWRRDALFADPNWEEVRLCAGGILAQLPDEVRDSDYLRQARAGR